MILDVIATRPKLFQTSSTPFDRHKILQIHLKISIDSILAGISAFSVGSGPEIKHLKVTIRFFEQASKKGNLVMIGTHRGQFCIVESLFEPTIPVTDSAFVTQLPIPLNQFIQHDFFLQAHVRLGKGAGVKFAQSETRITNQVNGLIVTCGIPLELFEDTHPA